MRKLERGIRGLVQLEAVGPEPEKLLNACLREEIELSAPRAADDFTLRFGIAEKDLSRTERLAVRCGCELRILSRTGGSRTRQLLRRRLGLLLMTALLLCLLFASSLFIWEIKIVGGGEIGRGELFRTLEDCGLRCGCFWPSLDLDALRDRVLLQTPELAWMSVNIRGSIAELLLLPREEKPEIYRESEAAELRASHAGVVRRVSALNGNALVQPGQTVAAGELLIAARMESITAEPRELRARGEVWADTWYELTAVCPAARAKVREKKGFCGRLALKIGEKQINFYQNSGKTIDGYDKIIHDWTLGVNGLFRLPLGLVAEDLRPYQQEGTPRNMTEQLQQNLLATLAEGIEGSIVSSHVTVAESGGVLIVTLHAQCREDIARLVDITQELS